MSTLLHVPHGNRKVQHAREMIIALTIAFVWASWCGISPDLFGIFCGALLGISGAFTVGNIKEHSAKLKEAANGGS